MTTMVSIEPLIERLLEGGAASVADREALVASRDLLTLGMAADTVRRRRHGDVVTFLRVADVAIETAANGDASWQGSPAEVRLVGAPRDLPQAVSATQTAVRAAGGVPVTGFSLADLCRLSGGVTRLPEVIESLAAAGLTAISEAPMDQLDDVAGALSAARAVSMPVLRLTIERARADRGAWLGEVVDLVAAHPEITVLAPLPQRASHTSPSTGYDDVHVVAVARLLVPVAHIQVDWRRYGPKLAQVALTFGADDIDGVCALDEMAEGRRRSPLEEIRRNILAASSRPVERGPFDVVTR